MITIHRFIYNRATLIDSYEITRECWTVDENRTWELYTELMSILPAMNNGTATPEEVKYFNENLDIYNKVFQVRMLFTHLIYTVVQTQSNRVQKHTRL